EYLIGGSRNAAARHWVWEQVVPYVEERWPSAQRWVAGGSNGASMAAQLALGRPDLFTGAALYSPWHGAGLDEVLGLAERWPGGGRFYVSHGNFGRGEQGTLEGSRQLIQRLAGTGATTHFLEREGHGHNLHAWGLSWPDALRWLLSERK
ncbi:MAG: enterochelin esterase, partial [Firmicutes bacterium]|nr:enterochelin esterase [Bacillota bacterium]